MYIVCYIGYALYERFWLGKRQHMVPLLEVDLDTDAVCPCGKAIHQVISARQPHKAQSDRYSEVPSGTRTALRFLILSG